LSGGSGRLCRGHCRLTPLEQIGLLFEILGHAQPRFPDRRIAGLLGKFAVPRRQFAKFLWIVHGRPESLPCVRLSTREGVRRSRAAEICGGYKGSARRPHQRRATTSAARPTTPLSAVASGAPIASANRPKPRKPSGPTPMQTERTPYIRLRISAGAARQISVACMTPKAEPVSPVSSNAAPANGTLGASPKTISMT